MANKLLTQADGRCFAMSVLGQIEDLDAEGNGDLATICPFDPTNMDGDESAYYRTGPQWTGFADALEALFERGSAEARKGFASVFTDVLASGSVLSEEAFADQEEKGLNQDLGTPGTALPLPKETIARAFRQFMSSTIDTPPNGQDHG